MHTNLMLLHWLHGCIPLVSVSPNYLRTMKWKQERETKKIPLNLMLMSVVLLTAIKTKCVMTWEHWQQTHSLFHSFSFTREKCKNVLFFLQNLLCTHCFCLCQFAPCWTGSQRLIWQEILPPLLSICFKNHKVCQWKTHPCISRCTICTHCGYMGASQGRILQCSILVCGKPHITARPRGILHYFKDWELVQASFY